MRHTIVKACAGMLVVLFITTTLGCNRDKPQASKKKADATDKAGQVSPSDEEGGVGSDEQTSDENIDGPADDQQQQPEQEVDPQLDSDGDGITDVEEARWHTSPFDPDTDGDGFEDGYEVYDLQFNSNWEDYPHKFNPLIADLPTIDIELTSQPLLTMNFETSDGTSKSISNGQTNERGVSQTVGNSIDRSLSYETSVSVSPAGGTTSTLAASRTYGWSQSQTQENRQVYSESLEFSNSHNVSKSGGKLSISVDVSNPGNIAYTVRNLTLNALLIDPENANAIVPIGNLLYGAWGSINEQTLRTQNRGKMEGLVFQCELNLDMFNRILRSQGNVVVKISGYQLEGPDGPLDMDFTNIGAKTAEITIDYAGKKPLDSFLVSAYAEDGRGILLKDALTKILRINHRNGEFEWNAASNDSGSNQYQGFTSIRNINASAEKNSRWVVGHKYQSRGNVVEKRYDPLENPIDIESIMIKPGHQVNIVYLEDADRDGLGIREEFVYGTNPEKSDSDNDYLDDRTEVMGWEITVEGKRYKVRTDPNVVDTDEDVVPDFMEKRLGTNPIEGPIEVAYSMQYGSKQMDIINGIASDGNGNIYSVGKMPFVKNKPLSFGKINENGTREWNNPFAHDAKGANTTNATSIAMGKNGKLYVALSEYLMSRNKVVERNRLVLRIFDSKGKRVSDTIVSTPQTELPTDTVIDEDGNVYVAGTTSGNLAEGRKSKPAQEVTQTFIAKFNADGKLLWTKQFESMYIKRLTISQGKFLILAGASPFKTDGNQTQNDIVVKCLDLNANQIWLRRLEYATTNESFGGVATDLDGNVFVSGTSNGSVAGKIHLGKLDGFIVKLDAQGNVAWADQFGTAGDERIAGITCDSSGRIHIAGTTTGDFINPNELDPQNANSPDVMLVAYDTSGNRGYKFMWPTDHNERVTGIISDQRGDVFVVGTTNGVFFGLDVQNAGAADNFVIRMTRKQNLGN